MQISAAQCRAARSLLGWSQADLSEAAKVNKRTVMDFESGARSPHPGTLSLIVTALQNAGVDIIAAGEASTGGGEGVRLRSTTFDGGQTTFDDGKTTFS